MSYTPTTWQTGDTITAEKLNNMEGGIAKSAVYDMLVTATITSDYDGVRTVSVNKTASEVESALSFGKNVGMLFVVNPYEGTGWSSYATHSIGNGVHSWAVSMSGTDVNSAAMSSIELKIYDGGWLLSDELFPNPLTVLEYDPRHPPYGCVFGVLPGDGQFGWQKPSLDVHIGTTFEPLISATLLQAQSGKATLTTTLDSDNAAMTYDLCQNVRWYLDAGWGATLKYVVSSIEAIAVATSATFLSTQGGVDQSATFSGRLAVSFTSSTVETYDITFAIMAHDEGGIITAIGSVTAERVNHTFIS